MKTTIWASCPKCQTELKIDTNETELVQIECPDCHKVFAAKVPARAAAPMPEVFAPMPSLPAFQPAQVHYTPRKKSDDSLNPAALTALIVVCASAILIPLGFGGYYLYGKLSEQSLLAPPLALNNTTESSATPPANVSDDGLANTPINATPAPINSPNNSAIEVNAQPNISRKMPPPSDPMGESALAAGTPFENSPPQTDSMVFGVPELNPPPLIQQGPTTPQTVPAPNSTPMTSSPVNPGTSSPTWASPDMVNPSMNNPGVVNPGVVNPGVVNPGVVSKSGYRESRHCETRHKSWHESGQSNECGYFQSIPTPSKRIGTRNIPKWFAGSSASLCWSKWSDDFCAACQRPFCRQCDPRTSTNPLHPRNACRRRRRLHNHWYSILGDN